MPHAPDEGPRVGPQVIFGTDSTGRCTLSVGRGLAALGVAPGELVGQDLFVLYQDDPEAQAHLHRVLAGESFDVERDFGGRRLSVYFEPVRDDAGHVTGALGVTTDVTEQRLMEREAEEARERANLLTAMSATLNSEVPDLDALLRAAVRSVTEAVADVGVIWLSAPGGRLAPGALWVDGHELRTDSAAMGLDREPRPLGPGSTAAEDFGGAQRVPLDAPDPEPSASGLIKHLAARLGLEVCAQAPLRSRGHLVGLVEVARRRDRGVFTEQETGLVADLADRCALSLDNAMLLKAESDAREQLLKFQALADASDDLIAISDGEDRLLYVNPRVHKAGIELHGDDVWATIAAQAGEPARRTIREALAATGRWCGDLEILGAGEGMVAYVDAFHLSHPGTGSSLGTAWIVHDVTELRRTEAALRSVNADLKQFKALVETSPDFIAIAGLDGQVRYVNPQGRAMIGMPPEVDVTTTTIADYLTPEGLEASLQVEQPAVIAEGHWEGESTLRSWRGPAIPVAIASFLMLDAETGEPFALATVQRDLTERVAAEASLRELAEQREALLTRLVDAQDAERERIAADVHDDPVQALAAVDLRLQQLRKKVRERAPELDDAWTPLQGSVTGAIDRLRALLFDLEPPDLLDGLTGALRRAAGETFEHTSTRWTVEGDREPNVPDATRTIAYRIAKEALANVRKHAGADHVFVTVRGRDGGLEVVVADDGVGLGPGPVESSPGHRGLFNMRDRAAMSGGQSSVANRPEGGTCVTVWLPGPRPVD